VEISGAENIPQEGPLLITSNHPGAYDFLVIAASIPRNDLKVVSSAIPFVENLPNTGQQIIFTSMDVHARMMVVRSIIRYLKEGCALLIFPSGRVDPDPDIMPGAIEAISSWSPSIELIMRKVPQAKVLITVVKGVLSPLFIKHPIARLRKEIRDQQRLAEFLQVIQQMLIPRRLLLSPKVYFDVPITETELQPDGNSIGIMQSILNRAQALTRLSMRQ
jgi:hypothetical protein